MNAPAKDRLGNHRSPGYKAEDFEICPKCGGYGEVPRRAGEVPAYDEEHARRVLNGDLSG